MATDCRIFLITLINRMSSIITFINVWTIIGPISALPNWLSNCTHANIDVHLKIAVDYYDYYWFNCLHLQPRKSPTWTLYSVIPRQRPRPQSRLRFRAMPNTRGPAAQSLMRTWSLAVRPPTTRVIALGQPKAWAWAQVAWVLVAPTPIRYTRVFRMRLSATTATRAALAAWARPANDGAASRRRRMNWI